MKNLTITAARTSFYNAVKHYKRATPPEKSSENLGLIFSAV